MSLLPSLQRFLRLIMVTDVEFQKFRFTAGRHDFIHRLTGRLIVRHVIYYDMISSGRQFYTDRSSDSAASACHQCCFHAAIFRIACNLASFFHSAKPLMAVSFPRMQPHVMKDVLVTPRSPCRFRLCPVNRRFRRGVRGDMNVKSGLW